MERRESEIGRPLGRRRLLGTLGGLVAGLTLAACGLPATARPGAPAVKPVADQAVLTGPQVVTVDASDFAFGAPETIEGGLVTLRLRNLGQEHHHAQLLRLKEGVSLEQFMAALPQGEAAAAALITAEGGPSLVGHGGSSEVTVDLRPGQYLLACFIPSPDGVPHLAKGMIKPLRVLEGRPAAAPHARETFTMRDFAFAMPASLPAGRYSYRVVNEGPQPHELVVMRLGQGKSIQDVIAFFSGPPAGPPPFEPVGGMQGLEIGGAGFMTLDLAPGQYAAVCLIPDPASGKPHLHLGMAAAFTVR